MSRIWILVAESSRAKLYKADNRKAPLTEVEALVHPAGRLHEGDLVSDRPGSDPGTPGGQGQGRHVVDNKISAKQAEDIDFARYLARHLDQGRIDGAYDELVLIAPPAFLGLLRNSINKEVMERVSEQIDKNLVQQSPEALREQISVLL
ncbi:MAG TPA: host attachment protein [Gammaproteobacteria bacterium]|nr:host attachment protein [Gammaproteobacteria bacterium]